jgi:hypothetical protein
LAVYNGFADEGNYDTHGAPKERLAAADTVDEENDEYQIWQLLVRTFWDLGFQGLTSQRSNTIVDSSHQQVSVPGNSQRSIHYSLVITNNI